MNNREVEEKFEDVLLNIEFAILGVYREHPESDNYDVSKALEALIKYYKTDIDKVIYQEPRLLLVQRLLFDRRRFMCDWRLGRRI
ncbi:MAG: hypothetical protein K0S74_779 [Chlamydiales bacterium]|jgi:regulator of sirC expression with transglutaminase-like and TPR domain|nr:hypothetical protein [Chlamydiales bacterium]